VAKHGNRAASSRCGSADVLEALGVAISMAPEQVAAGIERVGIAFMLAPLFHPATRFAIGPRREIGIRTVFNILGPLTNPARVQAQVLGVPDPRLVEKMAAVLGRLGTRHALVVCADDGMDEISVAGPTTICELREGDVRTYQVTPEELGVRRADPAALQGGTAEENAALMQQVLDFGAGVSSAGESHARDGTALQALRDVVALNAAAALIACDAAAGFPEALALARQTMESGKAGEKLEEWRRYSQWLHQQAS
jgi:anthranilate phosphoribosyltransferase